MTRNNFDFLRIMAALLVMYSHQFALQGGMEPVPPVPFMVWGGVGVLVFFSISGFLIARSWCEDPAPLRFLARRFLRIWPALAASTLAGAFLLGPALTHLPWQSYWTSSGTWAYLSTLTVFSPQYTLPGVFADNPYPNTVNGSLWTIPIEVGCYLALLLLGWAGALRLRWLLLAGLLTLAFVAFILLGPYQGASRKWSYEFGAFFGAGSLLYLTSALWRTHLRLALVLVSAIGLVLVWAGWTYMAMFLCLPFFVIAFGSASTPVIRSAGRFGDPSYGLYIYAFPIQQLVVAVTSGKLSVYASLSLSVCLTFCVAYSSWHLIEKAFLRLKPRRPLAAAPQAGTGPIAGTPVASAA